MKFHNQNFKGGHICPRMRLGTTGVFQDLHKPHGQKLKKQTKAWFKKIIIWVHRLCKTPKWVFWDFFWRKQLLPLVAVLCWGLGAAIGDANMGFKLFLLMSVFTSNSSPLPFVHLSFPDVMSSHRTKSLLWATLNGIKRTAHPGHWQSDHRGRIGSIVFSSTSCIQPIKTQNLQFTKPNKQTWPEFTVVVEARRILRNTNTTTTPLYIEPNCNWMACVCSKKETNQSPTKLLHLLPGVGWSQFINLTCFHSHNNHT